MVADTGYDALIMELVMLSMTDVDPQGNVLPELAAELPTPSWDNLISTAQDHFIKHPWLAIFPGLMIFITIISVNYIGDGLRHAFDPYKVLETVGEYT
jgi:ABC-type antimicrobial peptide transport system permease subunit